MEFYAAESGAAGAGGGALAVGVGVLRDGQVLRDLWLLPLRDCFGLAVWAWSFAGDTVVWRGERFRLKDGGWSGV